MAFSRRFSLISCTNSSIASTSFVCLLGIVVMLCEFAAVAAATATSVSANDCDDDFVEDDGDAVDSPTLLATRLVALRISFGSIIWSAMFARLDS